MKILSFSILLILLSLNLNAYDLHPATFTFDNRSDRAVKIKVMKMEGKSVNNASKYRIFSVMPYSQNSVTIQQTGDYFIKTMAEKRGENPVFGLGNPFNAYVGKDGYSEITVKYELKASHADLSKTRPSTKHEFDKD